MREILFRGKRIDNGEWVYGYAVKGNDKKGQMFIAKSIGVGFFTGGMTADEVISETVGQYTGLTDKNGNKIFENGYIIIDKKTYKVTFNNAEYILTNIFNCDIITLKNNSIRGVFVDEI